MSVFWRERAAWPFVHAVVPLALYFVLRDAVLALLLIYVWETVETLLALGVDFLTENKLNALVGDPLIGGLNILGFFLLDRAFGWDEAFCATVPTGLRVGAFLVIGVASFAAIIDDSADAYGRIFNFGAALLTLIYAGAALAFFNAVVFHPTTPQEDAAGESVRAWLLVVGLLALVAVPRPDPTSPFSATFVRVGLLSLLSVIVALIVYGTRRA